MYDIKNILEPKTIEEALEMYQQNENLRIIAGGTDVLIRMHHGRFEEAELLSLRNIASLEKIALLDDGTISIGAMASFAAVFRNDIINQYIPVLAEAAVSMGGPQVRNMATIGGNVCNGAVSADSAPTLFCLNALLKIESATGNRIVPITEFYAGPGRVKLQSGEILTAILITKENYEDKAGKYIKFSNRKAMDIAKLSVATVCEIKENKIVDLRIALGVSAPTPIRCLEAEAFAKNKEVNEENLKEIRKLALNSAKPRDSWRGSKEYREHLIQVLTERAIKAAVNRLGGNANE